MPSSLYVREKQSNMPLYATELPPSACRCLPPTQPDTFAETTAAVKTTVSQPLADAASEKRKQHEGADAHLKAPPHDIQRVGDCLAKGASKGAAAEPRHDAQLPLIVQLCGANSKCSA